MNVVELGGNELWNSGTPSLEVVSRVAYNKVPLSFPRLEEIGMKRKRLAQKVPFLE